MMKQNVPPYTGKDLTFTSVLEENLFEGMKIAVCKEFIDVTDAEINVAVNKAIHKLVEAGAELRRSKF